MNEWMDGWIDGSIETSTHMDDFPHPVTMSHSTIPGNDFATLTHDLLFI
jgi:hypothetical protein